MNPWVDALVVLASVFASGLLGLHVRNLLPTHHLQEESVGMVRLCTGVIATLAALVLGLLVASAKANYDRVNDNVTHAAATIVLLDQTLAQYGPQSQTARNLLRAALLSTLESVFSEHSHGVADLDNRQRLALGEKLQYEMRQLAPENDTQRTLKASALELARDIVQTRLLIITQAGGSIPPVLLVVLVLWLVIMFAGFGLITSRNPTVIVVLLLCALSLAGAVLMIEELNQPLEGFIRVSAGPMRYALAHLGQ
ncbi:MAG: DUF4239 domain-containing protein [Gammaproteobacteria bacterium]|nr:DUF4239 domain-containing protein [Gammaproteobacteria bacterium]